MQNRVAIRAIYSRAKDGFQIHAMPGDIDLKVWSGRLAFDLKFLQHATKLAG